MTPAKTVGAATDPLAHSGGFEFVRDLARALADGDIRLPSYPKVALRLQELLADEDTDAGQLVRVLGAEPVLAGRIAAMAGSAALNPAGRKVADLRTAVVLLGHDALRTTTAAYAMAQIRQADEYRSIAAAVAELWQESAQRAAMSFVLARHAGVFRPDTAMLAGILAGVGKLYLLARASHYPDLYADQERFREIVRDWQARVAQALLENWLIAPEIVAAVRGWGAAADEPGDGASLADVLASADLLLSFREQPELLQGLITEHRPSVRLGLKAGCARLLEDSAAELAALQAALDG
ncbi:MAG: HDOD domain-containing protein [Steroidobacteraceae bacterium]